MDFDLWDTKATKRSHERIELWDMTASQDCEVDHNHWSEKEHRRNKDT